MKKMHFNTSLVTLAIVFVGGCATTTPLDVDYRSLEMVNSWRMVGKIAVLYPNKKCDDIDCKLSSDQGGIVWEQRGKAFRIEIADPFGKVITVFSGNEKTVMFENKHGVEEISSNKFIQDLIKIPIPFVAVKDWSTGRMSSLLDNAVITSKGFKQNNVLVSPTLWRKVKGLGKMPTKIVMKLEQNQIRLVVKDWKKITN